MKWPQRSQTGITGAVCSPPTWSVRPLMKLKMWKCPKMASFLAYFRNMRPLDTFKALCGPFLQTVELEHIWVWDPCSTTQASWTWFSWSRLSRGSRKDECDRLTNGVIFSAALYRRKCFDNCNFFLDRVFEMMLINCLINIWDGNGFS